MANAANIKCGNAAVINGVTTMARWAVFDSADSGPYSASNVSKGTGRGTTNRRVMVRYSSYGGTPAYFPGDTNTFVGISYNGTDGIEFDFVCKRTRIIAPVESEQPYIYHIAELVNSSSTVTYGTVATPTDSSTPDAPTALDARVKIDGVNEPSVSHAELEFMTETREHADTDSGGFWINVAGCRLDARLTYRLYEGRPSSLKQPNAYHPVQFWVSTTTYWAINMMRFRAINGWEADHEGLKPVGGTIVGEWDATQDGSGTGSITDPASVQKWPPP